MEKTLKLSYQEWMESVNIQLTAYEKIDVKIQNSRACAKSFLWVLSFIIICLSILGGIAAVIGAIKH